MRVTFLAGVIGFIFVYNVHISQNNETLPPQIVNPAVDDYKGKENIEEIKDEEEYKYLSSARKYALILHLPISKHIKHIEKRCNARGWGEQCVRDTIALAKQESLGGKVMVGDNGKSHGWYHIQTKLHGITKEQANDIIFATDWIHDRWERFGYPLYRSKAIASHNCPACGYSGVGKNYANSVKLKSEILKNK